MRNPGHTLSIFLCSLTGWSGLYFHIGPDCDSQIKIYYCIMITVATIAMHFLFVCWGIINICRSKIEEVKADSLERRTNIGGKNKVEAALHIPKANDEAVEPSFVNPMLQARVAKQSNPGQEHVEESLTNSSNQKQFAVPRKSLLV